MFYLSSLTKELCIHPRDITEDMKTALILEIKKLEGKIMGNTGYIVHITEFNQISDGKIDNETGKLLIKINYKAITFKLEEGEIVHALPFYINEHGFFSKIGNCKIFTSKHMIEHHVLDVKNGIWKDKTNQNDIKINKLIKLKIIKIRINSNEISAMGILC